MFDPYYETKVNQRIPSLLSYTGFGFLIIGIGMVVITIVDLNLGMTRETGSAWQENSIWPTIGKGIWVGAILLTTGVIGLIIVGERTQVGLYVFNGFTWTSAVFSLYLGVSSFLHFLPYLENGFSTISSRNYNQNIEFNMNIILAIIGGLGFVYSLVIAFVTCRAGNCCMNRRKYDPMEYEESSVNSDIYDVGQYGYF